MFGTLRFVLAIFVVIAHLTETVKSVSHLGVFAVFGFYIVSGYLMTAVLNKTYKFDLKSFALNRFLRLFPVYYLVVLSTLIAFYLLPNAEAFHVVWYARHRLQDIAGNLAIFPFEFYDAYFRIVPPAWSVAVELVCYFLLWLFIARSKRIALVTAAVATTYHIASLVIGQEWSARYFPFYAAILPFSIGSCIYYFRERILKFREATIRRFFFSSAFLWIFNLIVCGQISGLGGNNFSLFFYINLVLLVCMVAPLTTSAFDGQLRATGKILGDLAYPVFLTHWVVAFAISGLLLDGQHRGWAVFYASIIPVIFISYAISRAADKLVEPIRDTVRNSVLRRSPKTFDIADAEKIK
ncbi:acyltransferase family protein [Pseudomonas chlororaphis]|uniref:acyltransferase family protein n=1 Tax=Pseudomonas chlororaphis TaxID=587753 RepID=UPI002365356A|nr:acyltransferase [Pseudomonas chlororaphis]WDH24118.1 acyltransferase [Pseudomonas chlororaphis]